jgi:iron complex transport system permease protein
MTAVQFQRRALALNAMLLGESEARHLGINVERLKLELILMTAVAVGIAVANTGVIGFVGLVVPHIVRMLTGPDHRLLLPLSAVCGALMLLLADTLARVLVPPAEIPVGIITALIGAPFFLGLLIKQRSLGRL